MKCPKSFWHRLFTSWRGESKKTTTCNYLGAKPEVNYWFNKYFCNICGVHYNIDVKFESEEF